MNLNKQDFAAAMLAVGFSEGHADAEKAAVHFAGMYCTGSKEQQIAFLQMSKGAASKAITMLQQLNEKLDAELTSITGGDE